MANVLSDQILEDLGRSRFRSSGRVDWLRLMPLIPVGIIGGLVVAAVLTVMQECGLYFIVLVPALAAFATYWVAGQVVERGHCRNKLIAVLIAIPIGLIAYLGYYQGQLAWGGGWEGIYRIDLLPKVIWMNWETQVFVHHGRPGEPGDLQFYANVVVFLVELLTIVIAAMFGGSRAAGRVYSESDECWAKSITRIVPEMWGTEVEPSVRAKEFPKLLTQVETLPVPDPKHPPPRTILTLEVFGDGQSPTAYLSVTHVPKWTTVVVSQLLLTPEEFQACRLLFQPEVSDIPGRAN